jgi:very-short-patch-repair endonuclease
MGYATYETRERAKREREELSTVEVLLWDELRSRRLDGLKFRRKHPMFTFVLDFYCPSARLALQLGDTDDATLHRKMDFIGVHVLRIEARAITEDIDRVLDAIRTAARLRLHPVAGNDASATLHECDPSACSVSAAPRRS